MKGIILAGGKATRLYPITRATCKQLLPVYDKPMIYYPLSVLMLAGIRDILLICSPSDLEAYQKLFGNGNHLGIDIKYAVQEKPQGIAQAFLIGADFIGKDSVCLVLGDNLFFGNDLISLLKKVVNRKSGATIFAYNVKDPQRYGVVTFDKNQRVTNIVEKPKKPLSKWAVTGIYFYDHKVVEVAKRIKPSKRGELEITDVNKAYFRKKQLSVELLGRGNAWLDTGTFDSLLDAGMFIKTIEDRQGLKIGCIEEVAYRMGFIKAKQVLNIARTMKTNYGEYLRNIVRK
jgi:glucose-1-phosphate thymidylyltransferase